MIYYMHAKKSGDHHFIQGEYSNLCEYEKEWKPNEADKLDVIFIFCQRLSLI